MQLRLVKINIVLASILGVLGGHYIWSSKIKNYWVNKYAEIDQEVSFVLKLILKYECLSMYHIVQSTISLLCLKGDVGSSPTTV